MLKFIKNNNFDEVFQIWLFLKMYFYNNCSGKRSFSVLKCVKNYLQSTELVIININKKHWNNVNSTAFVDELSANRARKMYVYLIYFFFH